MVMQSARIVWNSFGAGLFCGVVLVMAPGAAQAQPTPGAVEQRVEQQMEASESTLESAATAVEEPAGPEPAQPSESPTIEIQPMAPSAESAGEPEAPPVAEPSPMEEPAEVAEAEPAPPSSYTVQSGDTLWSISSTFLSDPFYWPKLWNVNPTVTNPDLIFPGNVLMLPVKPPVAMAEAEAEAPPTEMAEAVEEAEEPPMTEAELLEEPVEEAPQEAPLFAEEEMIAELPEEKAPSFEVLPPPPTQSKEILALSSGYIAKGVPVAGRVVGTHEYRILLGEHDRVHLLPQGEGLEPQGRYTIYRRIKRVVHPVSNRVVGDLIQILGEVDVEKVEAVATGTIVKSFGAIEPGDYLMPTHAVEAVPMAPVVEGAGEALSGVVLEVVARRHLNAEFDIVYIDRGESAGVVAGDRFRIFRQGERAPAYARIANVRLPDRLVGELEILNVQADTATALLTRSAESVVPGDRIER